MKFTIQSKDWFIRLSTLAIGLLFIINVQSASAQLRKSKKSKKQERLLQKFKTQKQALVDTSFAFQTKLISIPAVSQNTTGGYLNIENKTVRIQEFDWLDNTNTRTRIRDEGKLENYTLNQTNSNSITVSFECRIKGVRYYFFIKHSLDDGSVLRLSKQKREMVTYTGNVRPL